MLSKKGFLDTFDDALFFFGISRDNDKIAQKMNSWLRSEAFRAAR